jgi:hypothetical protein
VNVLAHDRILGPIFIFIFGLFSRIKLNCPRIFWGLLQDSVDLLVGIRGEAEGQRRRWFCMTEYPKIVFKLFVIFPSNV